MSEIVTTDVGRFRRVTNGQKSWFLWECPHCRQWGTLSDDQWNGKVSVHCECNYHETHDFGAALVARMQARILSGESPVDSEPCDDGSR